MYIGCLIFIFWEPSVHFVSPFVFIVIFYYFFSFWVLCVLWMLVSIRCIVGKDFLLSYRMSLHCAECFNFVRSNLSAFDLLFSAAAVTIRSPYFSSILKFLPYLFCNSFGAWVGLSAFGPFGTDEIGTLFHSSTQGHHSPAPFVEGTVFTPMYIFSIFVTVTWL